MLALVVVWFATAVIGHAARQSKLDDDRVYLYSTNFTITAPEQYAARSQDWAGRLEAANYAAETSARFAFRQTYANNYLIQSAAIAGLRAAWPPDRSGLAYPEWMRRVVILSGAIVPTLAFGGFLFAFRGLGRSQQAAAALALAGLALLSFSPAQVGYRASESLDLLYPFRAAWLLVQPGYELSPFGIQCRNAATMLLATATLFRWRGATAWSYWMAVAAGAMHATYGGLILLILLGLDALLTPKELRRPAVVVPIALAVAWAATHGVSFGAFASPVVGPALFLAAVLGLIMASLLPMHRVGIVRHLREQPPRIGELQALVVAVLAVLYLVALVAPWVHGLARTYIVDELSGRPLGLLRLPLALCLASVAVDRLSPRAMRQVATVAAGLLIVYTPLATALLRAGTVATPSEAEVVTHAPSGNAGGRLADGNVERAAYFDISARIDGAR